MRLLFILLCGCAASHGGGDCPPLGEAPGGDSGGGTEGDTDEVQGGVIVLEGGTLLEAGAHSGQVASLRLEGGLIVAVGEVDTAGATVVDVSGRFVVPAFIDSHVHLAYLPVIEDTLDGGVAAAVDLAAPLDFLATDPGALRLLRAGPMITAPGGYPTQGWGRNGYGLECGDQDSAVAAVGQLQELGADLIKVPLNGAPELEADTVAAVVAEAHGRGLKVAVHALDDGAAGRGAAAGADLLAHTPTRGLEATTLAAWSEGAVVSTLAAFGGSSAAVGNLRDLEEAGATVLYGTDLGNLGERGISPSELSLMAEAGLSGAQILAAGTSVPASYWGLDGYGQLEAGAQASLLVLSADPREEPLQLASPEQVWIRGTRR